MSTPKEPIVEHYHMLCPRDGSQLLPNAGGPDTPPWRCDECHLSWWVAELSQEARKHYRREQQDWGHMGSAGHKAVREAVHDEMEVAAVRGVSLRREQLGLFSKHTIDLLLERHHVTSHFHEQMRHGGQ